MREVGPDPALLLLTLRALLLRQQGSVRLRDLSWVLGVREGSVSGWIGSLSHAGAVVWHEEPGSGLLTMEVSDAIPGLRPVFGPEDAPPFLTHAVPTHWFVQVLPLVGRRAFLVFLYLRSRERADGLTAPLLVSSIVRSCRLRGLWHARLLLARLRRRGLVARAGRGFAVGDPRPPTSWERRLLRLRAEGVLPPTAAGRTALLLAVILLPLLVLLALLSLFLLR